MRHDVATPRKVHIVQGEFHVTDDGGVVLSTLLGSCVAACIHDPVAKVGGMNHFLLPAAEGNPNAADLRYGVHSMELLINGLLNLGARRERFQVWLFGGARMFDRLADIGTKNAEFAETFMRREDLPVRGGSLRGDKARRIQFWPTTGRARQLLVDRIDPAAIAPIARPPVPAALDSDVELF